MTIPIAKNQSDFEGLRHSDIDCISVRNLRRGTLCGKRKRLATAAFLGVSAVPEDVVAVCCNRTTFFTRKPDASRDWGNPDNGGKRKSDSDLTRPKSNGRSGAAACMTGHRIRADPYSCA
jgi:hypothetical protein